MFEFTPLDLSHEDKLDILRRLDEFHFWHSLDDVRLCTECKHSITGRQVQVFESKETGGGVHLRCPTEGCLSVPGQWIYADPIRAAAERKDTGSFASRQSTLHDSVEVSSHGHVHTTRGKRPSLRAVLARLAILRSIATGLHGFLPII